MNTATSNGKPKARRYDPDDIHVAAQWVFAVVSGDDPPADGEVAWFTDRPEVRGVPTRPAPGGLSLDARLLGKLTRLAVGVAAEIAVNGGGLGMSARGAGARRWLIERTLMPLLGDPDGDEAERFALFLEARAVRTLGPAGLAAAAWLAGMLENYLTVDWSDIVQELTKNGWKPAKKAKQKGAKKTPRPTRGKESTEGGEQP